jgi:hypothetical protein
VNADGVVNAIDIDMTYDAASASSSNSVFDLDGNGLVDQADGAYLVGTILGTLPGDANLDGVVDGSDFNRWNDHKFQSCSTGWSTGDFNGDASTDASDFNIWLPNRFMPIAAAAHNGAARPARAALAVNDVSNPAVVSIVDQIHAQRSTDDLSRRNVGLNIDDGFVTASSADGDTFPVQHRSHHVSRAFRRVSSSEARGSGDANAESRDSFKSLLDTVFADL